MLSARRVDPPFLVSEGVFSAAQRMGWHLVDEKGFTLGVLCDTRLVGQMFELETKLRRLEIAVEILRSVTPICRRLLDSPGSHKIFEAREQLARAEEFLEKEAV